MNASVLLELVIRHPEPVAQVPDVFRSCQGALLERGTERRCGRPALEREVWGVQVELCGPCYQSSRRGIWPRVVEAEAA